MLNFICKPFININIWNKWKQSKKYQLFYKKWKWANEMNKNINVLSVNHFYHYREESMRYDE